VTREAEVIQALADHLADDRAWDRIVLRDIMDHRVSRMVQRLCRADTSIAISAHNGQPCPVLQLPGSWEQYLQECLTPASRKSLKKRLRVAAAHACEMSTLRNADPTAQLDILLRLAIRKGRDAPEHLQRCRRIFQSCILGECAEISVLWVNGEVAAAQGSFIDQHFCSIAHYLAGFDARFSNLSPGRVLDALCIQDAIERGFRSVDFLRGGEAYKHQLGGRPRFTHNILVTRPRLASRARLALSIVRDRLGV